MDVELKTVLDDIGGSVKGFSTRLDALQRQTDAIDSALAGRIVGGGDDADPLKKAFEDSAEFTRLKEVGRGKAAIRIGDLNQIPMGRKLLTGAPMTGVSGVLPPELIGKIVPLAQRRLFMRDLLYRGGKVTGSAIYYVRENVFTNAASPQAGEGSLKAETTDTFVTVQNPVQTISHWLLASRQVMDDLPALLAYVKTKLLYGLRYREEVQILSGDSTGNNLGGLIPAATAFNSVLLGSGWQKLDVLRRALEQVELADETPAGFFVINPKDWADLQTLKDGFGRYLDMATGDSVWGKPVVVSTAIAQGTFLCGSSESAELFDRLDAMVELSYEDRDNFIRNQVTLLCEERTVLAIYRPGAFITGTFTSSP